MQDFKLKVFYKYKPNLIECKIKIRDIFAYRHFWGDLYKYLCEYKSIHQYIMLEEILIEGRVVEPTLFEKMEDLHICLETQNPTISLCKSKRKYLKHLDNNLYSLCGEIKKVRTGVKRFSSGVITQIIVDCSIPILITLCFGDGFRKSVDFENYQKINAGLRIPFRIFRIIYYFLVDIYKINGAKSFPILITDNSKIRLKFLQEGEYIEVRGKLFCYLYGGFEENLVEQKIVGFINSMESSDMDKIRNDYFISGNALIKFKIRETTEIEYVELGDFLDQLALAVLITNTLIFGLFLLIVTWITYIIFYPFIIFRQFYRQYFKNNSERSNEKDILYRIVYSMVVLSVGSWLNSIKKMDALLEKTNERLRKIFPWLVK